MLAKYCVGKLIMLSDVYKLREEKEKELKFYQKKLEELRIKLFFISKEVELTNFIIDLIEKEKVMDLADLLNKKD